MFEVLGFTKGGKTDMDIRWTLGIDLGITSEHTAVL
jgi:hypothetical protein